MPQHRTLAHLLLLSTVFIWGASFALVKAALTDASPFVFNLGRMALATLALAMLNHRDLRRLNAAQLQAGAIAGLFLATGYQFQTLGLSRTTPAKSAFLTGMVVVFVAGLTLIPAVRPPGTASPGWKSSAAILAFAGLLLLTTPPGTAARDLLSSMGSGDLLTLVCAGAYAGHLLTLARVSPGIPAGLLATVQIATASAFMLLTLPLEPVHRLHFTPRLAVAWGITSLFATAAAFTIQSYAQQHLPATHTAVVLTLEPVFAWLTSLLVLHDHLSRRGLAGAALILLAIALIELLPSPGAPNHNMEIPA